MIVKRRVRGLATVLITFSWQVEENDHNEIRLPKSACKASHLNLGSIYMTDRWNLFQRNLEAEVSEHTRNEARENSAVNRAHHMPIRTASQLLSFAIVEN